MAERDQDEIQPGETRTTAEAEDRRRREMEEHQAQHPEEFAGRGRETDEARDEPSASA